MMVFINNGKKLHVSAYSGHLQVLTTFLLKEFYIICILYKTASRYGLNFSPQLSNTYKVLCINVIFVHII